MDPLQPIVPVPPSIPPVSPAPMTGRIDRDTPRHGPEERRRRHKESGSQGTDEPGQDAGQGDDDPGIHIDVTA